MKINSAYREAYQSKKRYLHLYGGAGCFSGDTLVNTYLGHKPISEVNKGDFVLTIDGYKQVLKKFVYPGVQVSNKMLIFRVGNTTIKCTPDHKFYHNGKFIPAIELCRRALEATPQILGKYTRTYFNEQLERVRTKENNEACFRCKRLLSNNDRNSFWEQDNKGTQGSSKIICAEPTEQTRSKSQGWRQTEQSLQEFGVGNTPREYTTCFRQQIPDERRRTESNLYTYREESQRDKKQIRTLCLHKKNAGRRIWSKRGNNKRCCQWTQLDTRKINYVSFCEPETVYDLHVKENHNYCITKNDILVHNSGKSWFAAQKIILRCLQEEEHRFLCLRKVARTLRHSVFQLLRDIIIDEGLASVVNINKSEMAFYFPNGSEIMTAGLDDVEKLKSISGITGIWIEEPTEIKQKEEFQQVDLRLRGDTEYYKQIILSYNPIDPLHWLKKEFHDTQRDDTFIVQTTYKDNPFIGNEYESVLSSIAGNMQTIYKHGNWGYANAPDQLIKIQWALGMRDNEHQEGNQKAGIDVARYGDDKTVFGKFSGNVINKIKSFEKQSLPETARQAYTFIQQNRIKPKNVGIDIVGYGAGVYDNLEEMGLDTNAIDSGSNPVDTYEHKFYTFNNLRSQMWWFASQELADGNVAAELPDKQFQMLVEDLTSVKYIIDDKKIKVQSKDELKKELGRSPDYGDMFVYGLFVDKLETEPWVMWG